MTWRQRVDKRIRSAKSCYGSEKKNVRSVRFVARVAVAVVCFVVSCVCLFLLYKIFGHQSYTTEKSKYLLTVNSSTVQYETEIL